MPCPAFAFKTSLRTSGVSWLPIEAFQHVRPEKQRGGTTRWTARNASIHAHFIVNQAMGDDTIGTHAAVRHDFRSIDNFLRIQAGCVCFAFGSPTSGAHRSETLANTEDSPLPFHSLAESLAAWCMLIFIQSFV